MIFPMAISAMGISFTGRIQVLGLDIPYQNSRLKGDGHLLRERLTSRGPIVMRNECKQNQTAVAIVLGPLVLLTLMVVLVTWSMAIV